MHFGIPRIVTALAMAASALVASAAAHADNASEIYPLDKVRPGQKGYGLTTLRGTTPERFEFEVIGVNHNFLPKMDIILVKSDDPKLQISGFWRGMSGSPLFIEGKLACAFSYGFRFNKVAIGGCTPLHYMMREGFQPTRRSTLAGSASRGGTPGTRASAGRSASTTGPRLQVEQAAATAEEWLRLAPERTVSSALARLGKPREPWLMRAPLPSAPARATPDANDPAGMVAAAVPLAMSGFTDSAFQQAKQLLSGYPLEPMRAGGTGSPTEGPTSFQPGGAIGVQLIRGDMSVAATGTVSYVDGSRVLGFGHPLFQAGEFYAPVTASQVHTVIPSAMNAFVVASPLRELGSLVQDRQSTIMASTRLESRMIPFDIYVESSAPIGEAGTHTGEFHVEVVDNRFLTGAFAGLAAMSAISYYLPDRDHVTVLMQSTVHVRGYEPLTFVDYLYAEDGASSVIGGARGLRALVPLLGNPFAPIEIDRVEMRASVHYNANFGKITELRLPTAELPPGKRSYVDVLMTTYNGDNMVERVPFDVPQALAGSIVRLEVAAGDSTRAEFAPPKDLDDLMGSLRQLLPGNVFAVTLYSAREGVAIDGKLVRDLPQSALDRLYPSSRTQRAQLYRPIARSVSPARRVLGGSASLLVTIAD